MTANGIRLMPDQTTTDWPQERRASAFPSQRLAGALDHTLYAITERCGELTIHVVAMQLEYPRSGEVR